MVSVVCVCVLGVAYILMLMAFPMSMYLASAPHCID